RRSPRSRRRRPPPPPRPTSPRTRPRRPRPRRMPAKRSRPPLIGLTGTIGAGKSTALAAFARHGCAVLDADAVVHDLYRRDDVRDTVAAKLGADVIGRDGAIARAAVARAIFGDDQLLGWLEGYLHPLVHEATVVWREQAAAAAPPPRALVEEVQLLFEGDHREGYDRTLVVTASQPLR